jgi:adenine phosphoribosyltransferase
VVAGLVAVCIEESERGLALRREYKCSSAVLPGTDWQTHCNEQSLPHFSSYRDDINFPSCADS